MKKMSNKILTSLAAATLVAGVAAAQSNSNSANRLAAGDNQFLTKAAQGGMAEVQMGNLALQHASSDMVKQFGQRMVTDHSKANDELKQVASKQGVTLPTEPDAQQMATMNRLSKMNGAAFDRAYMEDMVKDHTKDIAEFKKEATSGNDPEVKAFASMTLPTLEEHLKLAKQTENEVKK